MQILKKAILTGIWFAVLTFPIMVVKVDHIEGKMVWRWENAGYIAIGAALLSLVWRYLLERKAMRRRQEELAIREPSLWNKILRDPKLIRTGLLILLLLMLILPALSSTYHINIIATALIYVVLALGLNIAVGLSGQLVLGYAAFYAVGAYAYGLANHYLGIGFWTMLPVGGIIAALAGILLGLPVLRLRGDYLAIVTLGFGEITRLIIQNWSSLTRGPGGISGIAKPGFFNFSMADVAVSSVYIYYITLALAILTIFVVDRLKHSRVGRAWQALREDEIASEAMGVDTMRTKLSAFALSSMWAGFAGVLMATKTTFINPNSFTFMESALILSMVVLGGMGSIWGVVLGAVAIILLPEYLRAFSEYRMLIFGAIMVAMMVFRPQGLIPPQFRRYEIPDYLKKKSAGTPEGAKEGN